MPEKINPREVLAYLNELGFTNIDARQLKEFITDLKSLMKYEEQKLERKNKIVSYENNSKNVLKSPEKNDEIANRLYSQTTVSSKAKSTVPSREHITTIQINRPKSQYVNCIHCNENNDNKLLSTDKISLTTTTTKHLKEQNLINEPPTRDSDEHTVGTKKKVKKSESSKPKGFIRPQITTNVKNDPVALYHQYQSEWKKWKVLGDDRRSDLRWHIRDKMLRRI